MASPSEAEVRTQLKAAVDILDETRKFGNVNATNLVGLIDTFDQNLESDFSERMRTAVEAVRRAVASAITRQQVQNVIRPHLQSYVKHVIGKAVPAGDQELIDIVYRYFQENTISIQTRTFTFNSPAAGGANVGDGTVLRCTKDENNFDLEGTHSEAREARCIRDRNTGTGLDQEVFRFRGAPPGIDTLQFSGSGETKDIAVTNWQSSILQNTSFQDYSGTLAAPTDITSWTSNVTVSSTTYSIDETNYYRAQQGISTPRALNIKTTSNLVQKLSTFNRKLRSDVPYFMQIAWNRTVGSAGGTLLARLGAINNSVVAAAQSGWQILRVPSAQGQNNWYKSFDEQDLDISIEWTRTSGELLIDDVILAPMTLFNGTWYAITANDATHAPFLKDDIFTWSDTEVGAVIQYWIYRGWGRYLPHSGSPTITDP